MKKGMFYLIRMVVVTSAVLITNPCGRSAFGRLPESVDQEFASHWIEREGHTFFLNGQGIHTASIFNVRVYEISLFLEKRSKDPMEILNSPERKLILIKFLRDVGAEQLRSALSDGFLENCTPLCDKLKIHLDQLVSQVPDLKEGDRLEFQFYPSKVILKASAGKYSEVDAPHFGSILLSIWLGADPPSVRLKNEILGLK